MRLLSALVLALGVALAHGTAHADPYALLKSCLETSNGACLESVGGQLAEKITDPRSKSLMMARFALIDWASGDKVAGDTWLLRAWSHLADVPNRGCLPRVDATFDLEALTEQFGHQLASRLILRNLVKESSSWPKDAGSKCSRPADKPHWLSIVAERQRDLTDLEGLQRTLNLGFAWGMDPAARDIGYAMKPVDAAKLLADNGREADALKICESDRLRITASLASDASAADKADADWRALRCYRAAKLADASHSAYRQYAHAKLEALGLADAKKLASGVSEEDAYGPALWGLAQGLTWSDPVLFAKNPDAPVSGPRACFEQPTAQCLSVHVMKFVNRQKRESARRASSYGRVPDFHEAGALDGFARFLVGAGGDIVGDEARSWFLDQTEQAPLENMRSVVSDATSAGDLVWARRMFYSWYMSGGEDYFHHLVAPNASDKRNIPEDTWPLHVAWSIALVVNQLDPAFEPEELASFAETAWDDGISQLPPLRDIPPTELIDADERSGTHLLDLCFRDSFGEWAAKLFTHAHLPDRAAQARSVLPEAARDCAFARRSIGPILRTATWYAEQGDLKETRLLLLEGADRLTRPHYHVYQDADPALGGAALAAMALGLQRGLLVQPPYDSVF